LVSFTRPGSRKKEKIKEAMIKPRTNFGNRSHITLTVGFSLVGVFFFNVHQTERKKAATPIRTFWENFTMVPTFIPASPTSAPAQSQNRWCQVPEPGTVTMSEIPNALAIHGSRTIMGMATIRISEIT
jgi:hypothetical protein